MEKNCSQDLANQVNIIQVLLFAVFLYLPSFAPGSSNASGLGPAEKMNDTTARRCQPRENDPSIVIVIIAWQGKFYQFPSLARGLR